MEKTYAIYASNVLSIMPKVRNILEDGKHKMFIEQKSGVGNIVTNIDKELENYISTSLIKLFPGAQIISEESADEIKDSKLEGLKFVVDPLDGTTNYTNGWPHTVSIGIIDNDELVVGVIYDVLSKKVYTGIKELGVTECDIEDITKQKSVIKPSYTQNEIEKALISYDTPYGKDAYTVTKQMSSELYHEGASLKIVGPISLDVLKTALGKENRPADYNVATWHTEVRAWDLAAATCILRELGGDIVGRDGKPLSTKILSSPDAKIAFIASGSEALRTALYDKYKIAEKIKEVREY